jgi:hypothetical protein
MPMDRGNQQSFRQGAARVYRVKEDPRVITDKRIVTERHKAEDILKMGLGWKKTGYSYDYKGITYWELKRS